MTPREKKDLREAPLEHLWADVYHTEKLWKHARASTPRGLQLILNVTHIYTMEQFWYCIDMIRDHIDQLTVPPRYFYPSDGGPRQ
tara:strand:+ start:10383 stop:10637 length:255 start_codon:yes stop_codon:yes gene_type:complete